VQILFPTLMGRPAIAGVALCAAHSFDSIALMRYQKAAVDRFSSEQGLRLLEDEGLGRFAAELPEQTVQNLLAELRVSDRFQEWLRTRVITSLGPRSERPNYSQILRLLGHP